MGSSFMLMDMTSPTDSMSFSQMVGTLAGKARYHADQLRRSGLCWEASPIKCLERIKHYL